MEYLITMCRGMVWELDCLGVTTGYRACPGARMQSTAHIPSPSPINDRLVLKLNSLADFYPSSIAIAM